MKISKRMVGGLSLVMMAFLSQATTAATVAPAAKLTQVQGDVMVNNGTRFVKATPGAELKPGAKIVTAKGATVSLVYQNGCIKRMQPNSMLTVGSAVECTAKSNGERVYVAQAIGDTATDAASPAETALAKTPGNNRWAAGLFTGGVIGGLIYAFDGDGGGNSGSNSNASPQ